MPRTTLKDRIAGKCCSWNPIRPSALPDPGRSHCILMTFTASYVLSHEMHIREDLAYDKHTGKMIGFTNLGDINNHLLAFERSIEENKDEENVLAKSMMVFMVRGLFTPLRFTYVQFPCSKVTGDLLFHPFWQAVYRLERMGLKVSTIIQFACYTHINMHDCFIYRCWEQPLMVHPFIGAS